MKKKDLVNFVSKKSGLSKDKVLYAVNSFLEGLKNGIIEDGKVTLVGFGTFEVRKRKARRGRNPKTGVQINIPAKRYVRFKEGKALKSLVEK